MRPHPRVLAALAATWLAHAGPAHADVLLRYGASGLDIQVRDNGRGAGSTNGDGSGHGLIGMRERVELFKGELTSGGSVLGGFTVRARLPL